MMRNALSLATIALMACSTVSEEVQKESSTDLKVKSFTCWDGSLVKNNKYCPPIADVFPLTCWDGSLAYKRKDCPTRLPPTACWDGTYVDYDVNTQAMCSPQPENTP